MPREIKTQAEPPLRRLLCIGSPTKVTRDAYLSISRFTGTSDGERRDGQPQPAIELLSLKKEPGQMRLSSASIDILGGSLNGGDAGQSEAIAYEVLSRIRRPCRLVAAEARVKYIRRSPVADMVVTSENDEFIGVSVTRIFEYCKKPLLFDSVCEQLQKKRTGLRCARAAVAADWRWDSGLVFVWVAKQAHLALVLDAWRHIAEEEEEEEDSEKEDRLADEVKAMGVKELKEFIAACDFDFSGCVEKNELVSRAMSAHSFRSRKGHVALVACHAENMARIF